MGLGDRLVQLMIYVTVMMIFMLWVMPAVIAPYLGITPEQYAQNKVILDGLGAGLGFIVSKIVSSIGIRIVTWSIRRAM